MARNSFLVPSINGLIYTSLHWTSADLASPPTMRSSNGRLRDECFNTNWFMSLDDAKSKIEAWRRHYNENRPHTAMGFVPPSEYAQLAARNNGP